MKGRAQAGADFGTFFWPRCKKAALAATVPSRGQNRTTLDRREQDALYEEAHTSFGPTLRRLVRGYEIDPERRRDLLQEIHMELLQRDQPPNRH